MAGKRTASNDLNHNNWDRDEEPEEAGSFSKAPEDVIKNRVIKVARRRNPISASTEENKGLFASFGGFNKPAAKANFGFLSNLGKDEGKSNGVGESKTTNVFQTPDNKKTSEKTNSKKSDEYYAKLKGLNQSVSSWIQEHVNTNPFISLKPIFCDYEKYLDNLETAYKDVTETAVTNKKDEQSNVASIFATASKEPEKTQSLFGFGIPQVSTATSGFTFNTQPPKSSFSTFATQPDPVPSKPFAFTNVTGPETDPKAQEVDEDEPPKVEFTPVVEEGHLYMIRCKVYVRKDGKFGERGVGNLFLKPIPDSEKVQLIVRADTNLGNLLCNFVLSSSIPISRTGKKDVLLSCVPTPDSKPPPVPVLFRVKSTEEADKLLKTLEKHQK